MIAHNYNERDEFEGSVLAEKYSIVRRIGRGGMGSVYEATHMLMDRTVAIKVVRANYAQVDHACLHRFRLEAKASSCLNHPNIMTVYDFGITDDGIAYLVMDYIDGVGLDEVLRQEGRLSLTRTVDIFTQACSALAHAHDKGVVHRDLKPSNIMLVHGDDGREIVKIVDFGIAKMLPGRARTAEVINDGGQIIGSPLYMSPEQCMNDDQDGRSDIYSLGCLLYQALSGTPPISDRHVLGIMYKHLNEPPQSFATLVPACYVPPDVEAVVMRALTKEPAQRQQTMRELASELKAAFTSSQNVLTDYITRSDTASTALGWDSHSAIHATGGTSDPIEQHYLRQLRAAADQHGAQHPSVVPHMVQLADYYISHKRPSRAERHLQTAIAALVESYGSWDLRVAEPLVKLADLYRTGGRGLDAEPLYHDLLSIKKNALGRNHPDIPFVLLRLAEVSLANGHIDQSHKYYTQCLRHAEAIFGPDDPVLSAIVTGLASVLLQMDELSQAAWLFHRALDISEMNLGSQHPAMIAPLVSLGLVYRKMQNWTEAELYLKRAISVHQYNFDHDTRELSHAMWLLAEVYSNRGEGALADHLFGRALTYFENHTDDESIAQLYDTFGVHFIRYHKSDLAEAQFFKALRIRERRHGRNSRQVAASLNLLGILYHREQRFELAEEYYRRSLAACRQLESSSELTSENLRALGDLYTAQSRFAEAEPAYIQALEVSSGEATAGQPPDAHTQQIINSLTNLYAAANPGKSEVNNEDKLQFET